MACLDSAFQIASIQLKRNDRYAQLARPGKVERGPGSRTLLSVRLVTFRYSTAPDPGWCVTLQPMRSSMLFAPVATVPDGKPRRSKAASGETVLLEALLVQQPFTRISFTARPSENVTIHSLFPSITEFPAANSVPAQVCT